MKKLLWTSALALTAMACLTACGDDDSGTSAGGDDELYTCDITAKKVVVKQNAGPYSVTMTYTHNEDGTMTTRYEYGTGHNNVCDGPMPTEVDEDDAEMTCKDNVLTVKTKEAVTTEEFQEYAGAATKACPEPASWGKDTKPSDDDDETDTGADDDEGGSVGDDGGSTDIDDDEGSTDTGDEDGDEGGQASDITCNFKKSDDTWVIQNGEGGGEMTVKWSTGKAVAVTKTDFGDAETCKMMLEILATDTEGSGTSSCDGGKLLMEDPDTYKDFSKDVLYSMYCAD
ncbi:MAG: hypothetical protein J5791_10830 [Fibrobacter sp.]|nr:hypothetical protein [Fibrobacter sp.]